MSVPTEDHIMQTYGRQAVAFVRGEGSYLYDEDGKRYLDALTGLAVAGLGHAHPEVTAAIQQQAATLVHTSNLYQVPNQTKLANRLAEISGMDRVFFGNSGAEANEAAIKIARLHGKQQGIKRPAIIATDESFHGRTMATLTATGNRKVHAGFEPLLEGFVRVPFNDLEAVRNTADNNPNVCAVLVEPIQGEGGIKIPDDNYLTELRAICDANNWLLMLDEVQTGNGRTGTYFAYMAQGFLPDVVTTAKGLGNGVPIGACLARGAAAELMQPGSHGSTYGGNPLVCAAALAVLETIERDGLAERAASLGARILAGFREALKGNNDIAEIRGRGLMLAIELHNDCPELVGKAIERGLLINVTQGNILRMLPPLTMSDAEADQLVAEVSSLISGD